MTSDDQRPPPSCTGTTGTGEPCRARPLTERDVCWHHAPDLADDRADARRRGGQHSATVHRLNARMPATLGRTVELLSDALEQTHAGRMPAARGQAVAALGRAIAAVYSEHAVEQRIAEVERSLAVMRAPNLRAVR